MSFEFLLYLWLSVFISVHLWLRKVLGWRLMNPKTALLAALVVTTAWFIWMWWKLSRQSMPNVPGPPPRIGKARKVFHAPEKMIERDSNEREKDLR